MYNYCDELLKYLLFVMRLTQTFPILVELVFCPLLSLSDQQVVDQRRLDDSVDSILYSLKYYDSALGPSRFTLWITGMRPFKKHIKPMILLAIAYQVSVNFMTMISFYYDKTFFDIIDIVVTEFLNIHFILRLVTFVYYEKEFQDIFQDMQKFWPITDPKLHTILKYLKLFQYFVIFEVVIIIVGLCIHGHITGERILHLHKPDWFPDGLFVFFFINGYLALIASMGDGFDMVFLSLIVLLLIQYKILNQTFKSFFSGGERRYSMQILMKQTTLLQETTAKINMIFGPMLLVYMWLIVVILAMLTYIVYERNGNPTEFLNYFMVILSIGLEVFAYYVVPVQILTNEINKLSNEIYCTQWYDCGLPAKKSLLMILTRNESDAVVTAYGKLVEINFKTCTSMFRTGFSVFTFLVHMKTFRTRNDEYNQVSS